MNYDFFLSDDELQDFMMSPHQYLRLLDIKAREELIKKQRIDLIEEVVRGLDFHEVHGDFEHQGVWIKEKEVANLTTEMVDSFSFIASEMIEEKYNQAIRAVIKKYAESEGVSITGFKHKKWRTIGENEKPSDKKLARFFKEG